MRLVGSLRRNWRVGILGFFATIVLVSAAAILVPARYVATTQMVLLPPLSQADTSYNNVVNPYLGLDGLDSMANVVATAMTDSETSQALQKAGVTQYTVTFDPLAAGPILVVQANGSSPKQASDAIVVVDQQVPLTLARLQREASISPSSFITVNVIARPSAPVKSGKTQLRAMGIAFVIGIVLTLLSLSFIDGWRIRRLQGPPVDRTLGESDGTTTEPRPAVAARIPDAEVPNGDPAIVLDGDRAVRPS